MTDSTKPLYPLHYRVGYCTNVHAGRDLSGVLDNLANHCDPIRRLVNADQSLCVGLWFSEISAAQALQPEPLARLKEKLSEFQLVPFTLNGFPQGDFHSQVVKHRVYQPTWWQRERLDYTLNLIELLDKLLPYGEVGSISTLPIAWSKPDPSREQLKQAAAQLIHVATVLHQLYERTGRKIVLAIEPEPGCFLTDSASFRMFYNEYLRASHLSNETTDLAGEYLTLCHDICHAAVMNENQQQELQQLKNDDISIGKVQVSSAISIDWDSLSATERTQAYEQVQRFAEDRYLHQTHCIGDSGSTRELIEDLPIALDRVSSCSELRGQWRIHFHVPIFLTKFGFIHSTQIEIHNLIKILNGPANQRPVFTGHFEVETYAWGVLPEAMKAENLNEGITNEVNWLQRNLGISASSR